jgi:hypothetical protein
MNAENEENQENEEVFEKIIIGVCAMAKKVNSKPMEAILSRLRSYDYFDIVIFPQETILNEPITEWPRCDCLISFYSKDFPLKKAEEYAKLFNPYLINDLQKQWDIMVKIMINFFLINYFKILVIIIFYSKGSHQSLRNTQRKRHRTTDICNKATRR